MSSRAIRRLREEQEASLLPENDDSEEEDVQQNQHGGFLGMLEESESENESSDDDEEGAEAGEMVVTAPKPSKQPPPAQVEEDIDAILSSFHDKISPESEEHATAATPTIRSLLISRSHGYDTQALDLDHAVRSLLGGGSAIAADPQERRGGNKGGRKTVKRYLFGRPKDAWGKPPSYVGGGLGCKELTPDVLEEERHSWTVPWPYNLDDSPTNQKWYTLTTSDTYQEQRYAYQDLLRQRSTEDPNALAMFVADHPHFAETLLQLSMVLYHVNDRDKGQDLLRRTMYIYEIALLSSVLPNNNSSDGSSMGEVLPDVYIDSQRQPNHGLFATLFRIMQTSGMSGCFPSALATGRFLLSLDPLRDPMGVLLILDYYALSYRQSSVIIENKVDRGAMFIKKLVESELIKVYYKDQLTDRDHCCELKDMPGWAYSYALALYRLANSDDYCQDELTQQLADDALIDAFTKFPLVLPKLLGMNKVNTQDRSFLMDWPKILPYFTADVSEDVSPEGSVQDRVTRGAGIHLVRIFIQRNHQLWARDKVIQWMYRCADTFVQKMDDTFGKIDQQEGGLVESSVESVQPQDNKLHLRSKFHPSLARYGQFEPSEYEDAFRTFPPEAIALNPNIIAPAMEFNPNRRGRLFRRGQPMPEEMQNMGANDGDLMLRLREVLGIGDDDRLEMLDPDAPLIQLYLQSLLPWNQVEGVRRPR